MDYSNKNPYGQDPYGDFYGKNKYPRKDDSDKSGKFDYRKHWSNSDDSVYKNSPKKDDLNNDKVDKDKLSEKFNFDKDKILNKLELDFPIYNSNEIDMAKYLEEVENSSKFLKNLNDDLINPLNYDGKPSEKIGDILSEENTYDLKGKLIDFINHLDQRSVDKLANGEEIYNPFSPNYSLDKFIRAQKAIGERSFEGDISEEEITYQDARQFLGNKLMDAYSMRKEGNYVGAQAIVDGLYTMDLDKMLDGDLRFLDGFRSSVKRLENLLNTDN